jgi:hypothetical protein
VSRIWEVGDEYIALDNPEVHAWRCQICTSLLQLPKKATHPALRHLKKKHTLLLDEAEDDTASVATDRRDRTDDSNNWGPPPSCMSLVSPMNVDRFRHHLITAPPTELASDTDADVIS